MTKENQVDIEEIRNTINFLKSEGAVISDIARETNITQSRLSQFLSGTYKGNNQKVASALSVWLENRQAQQNDLPAVPEFIVTPTVREIWAAFQYAQYTGSIVVVHGNPGVSKTTARDQFVATRPNIWTIRASRSRAGVFECLYEIALAVGVDSPVNRRGALARQIRTRLEKTRGLLIIDEADCLGYEMIEELRILQEDTKIGLVFIGNHNVYKQLTGNHRRGVDFARLFSRIAKRVVIERPRNADINAIADAWGLKDMELELINWLAKQPGALHTTFNVLNLASTFALSRRESVNNTHIKAAMKDLGCDVKGMKI